MKGWKTFTFNVLAAIPVALPIAIEILSQQEVRDVIPREWLPMYSLAITAANIVLRSITTTPIFRRE